MYVWKTRKEFLIRNSTDSYYGPNRAYKVSHYVLYPAQIQLVDFEKTFWSDHSETDVP